MFCVKCGKEAELFDALCASCFIDEQDLLKVPDHVDLEICAHCHSRKRGSRWLEPKGELNPALEGAVKDSLTLHADAKSTLRFHVKEEDPRNFLFTIRVEGTLRGIPFARSATTKGRLKYGTCTSCSRRFGGYYEAIVQLRREDNPLTRPEMETLVDQASTVVERLREEGDPNAFILKSEEEHGGLNLYMGTTNAGRIVSKAIQARYKARLTESPELVGRREGRDLYRVTFGVKLPAWGVGSVLVIDDNVLLVRGLTVRSARMLNLDTGEQISMDRSKLGRVHLLDRSATKEAVVVSESEREFQVLDPDSMRTVDLKKPPGFPRGRKTVKVVRLEERLLLLPE
ncbi:MAG: hypothetical protein HY556_00870 [Euryarchaeota archaeon]|nr:hypothetical protein [Euryarchaeota archaeon]